MTFISNVFTNYVVPAALSRSVVIGAGCLGAIPALEMAYCASQEFNGILENGMAPKDETETQKIARLAEKEKLKTTLFIRGVGALLFGACALNQFPGSGATGLLGFLVYSRFTWKSELKNKNPCLSKLVTGFGLSLLSHHKKDLAKYTVKIGVKIGSVIQKVSAQAAHLFQKILRAGIAFGKGVVKVIVFPFKLTGKFLKIFKLFIQHPKLGLGLLVGIVLVIGLVKYSHPLTGAAAVVAKTINVAVRGLFTAGALLIRGIGKTIRPLGTALSFVPTVLVKTVNGVSAVVYFIFHPLQAMGFAKVSTS